MQQEKGVHMEGRAGGSPALEEGTGRTCGKVATTSSQKTGTAGSPSTGSDTPMTVMPASSCPPTFYACSMRRGHPRDPADTEDQPGVPSVGPWLLHQMLQCPQRPPVCPQHELWVTWHPTTQCLGGTREQAASGRPPGVQSHLEGHLLVSSSASPDAAPATMTFGPTTWCSFSTWQEQDKSAFELLWINSGTSGFFVGKSKSLNRRLRAQSLPGYEGLSILLWKTPRSGTGRSGHPSAPRSIKQRPARSGPLGQPQADVQAPWGQAPFLVGLSLLPCGFQHTPAPAFPPPRPCLALDESISKCGGPRPDPWSSTNLNPDRLPFCLPLSSYRRTHSHGPHGEGRRASMSHAQLNPGSPVPKTPTRSRTQSTFTEHPGYAARLQALGQNRQAGRQSGFGGCRAVESQK